MLTIAMTAQFRRDVKRMKRRSVSLDKLHTIVEQLACEEVLAAHYRDHALSGRYRGFRECHITPDWLLIYTIDRNRLILTMARTGSHADLF